MEELNETNELAISKVIEEISKGPIFEITLKDCFNAFTKNIALKKEMKEMSKLVQSNQDQTGQIKVSQLRINAIEEKNALLEKDLEEKSKTNKLIMEKYKKYKEQSEKFEKKLNELTEKQETETQAIKAEYEKMLKTAEAQMEKYEIEIDELKYYLHDNEKLNEWMKEEINKADNGNKDKEEMIRKLKRGNAELKNQLKDKNKDSSTLPTTHSDIKKLITFLKKFLPEINQDKLDQFLKTYEELHFCHLCKKQVSYTLDSRKKHAEGFHGSINDKLVYYKCFPGAREMCRCGQQYTKISQKDHVKTHHYDVKYKCIEKECDFNGVLSEIEMHIKESHTNINDNDAALIQLVSHCFDLSIPGKLDRKDLKDRKPSNDGLSVLEMKLEEVIKLSNKKDSNEINVHDTSPTKREYNPTFEEGMMTPAKENNDSTLTQDGDVTIESSKMSGTKSNSDKENGNIGLEEDNIELLDYGDFYEDPEKNVDEEEDVDMPENWSKFEFDLISIQNSDNEDAQELEVREVSSEKVERENKDGEPEKEAEEKEDTEKSLDLSKITDSSHTSENNAHTPQNKTRNVDFQTPEGRESRISRISRRDTSDHENYRSSLSKLFEHRSSREAPDFHSSKPNAYRDFDREDKRFSSRFRESYANGQRKRKYGSQSPTDENRQHPPKSFRVSVNENGVRYIGNHVVEHLRDKNFHRNHREPEIFTNQEIQRFLNEADQNMFCRYFYNQNCKYGPNCILIHDKYEITKGLREELIRWQKTKMSKVMENTSSSDMQKAIREAAPHKMCQWFKKFGKCRFGQGCWDVHDDREITVGLKKEIEKLHH